ncbi:MAG: hypothetical protein K2W92_09110 [Alphaproteobacteria bacterium]|nr:hypothetical protein [Alphaproteobacteria bacterium]
MDYIFSTKPALKSIPIIANADFEHTIPIFTFPIGGTCHLQATTFGNVRLTEDAIASAPWAKRIRRYQSTFPSTHQDSK